MMFAWLLFTAAFVSGGPSGPSASCLTPAPRFSLEAKTQDLQEQVRATETAFAKTMADRDHEAFTSFLAEETIFFDGPTPIRGKEAVAEAWSVYFQGAQAPFSWEPEVVEVLDTGTLAISFGPVKDPAGNVVGSFNSIWRLDTGGDWKIVFDKGCPAAGE